MAYYIPTVRKSGGTRSPCPPPNCAHSTKAETRKQKLTLRTIKETNMTLRRSWNSKEMRLINWKVDVGKTVRDVFFSIRSGIAKGLGPSDPGRNLVGGSRKVYACAFRPIESTTRKLMKQNSFKLMVKFINLRQWKNVNRGALLWPASGLLLP